MIYRPSQLWKQLDFVLSPLILLSADNINFPLSSPIYTVSCILNNWAALTPSATSSAYLLFCVNFFRSSGRGQTDFSVICYEQLSHLLQDSTRCHSPLVLSGVLLTITKTLMVFMSCFVQYYQSLMQQPGHFLIHNNSCRTDDIH